MLGRNASIIGGLLLLSSCSKSYDVAVTVTIDPSVDLPEGAMIAFSVLEWDSEDFEKESADESEPVVKGQRQYKRTVGVCCAPDPTVRVYAFVDLDADRQHDAGEPWAQDPSTPVKLDDPVYTSTISIP